VRRLFVKKRDHCQLTSPVDESSHGHAGSVHDSNTSSTTTSRRTAASTVSNADEMSNNQAVSTPIPKLPKQSTPTKSSLQSTTPVSVTGTPSDIVEDKGLRLRIQHAQAVSRRGDEIVETAATNDNQSLHCFPSSPPNTAVKDSKSVLYHV